VYILLVVVALFGVGFFKRGSTVLEVEDKASLIEVAIDRFYHCFIKNALKFA
jgi:hypothetical protein